jgi:hypothetical protein
MIFSGKKLFELKATHGMPLDVAIQEIVDSGARISWGEFVDQARLNKWWDFQILELVETALGMTILDRDYRAEVIARMKLYMYTNKLQRD